MASSEEEEERKPKWEGKATTKLRGPTPQQVWPLFQDFCSFHNWLPSIDTCRLIDGVHGQPGLIRYCASTVDPSSIKWCHEKLTAMDPIGRWLSYEVVDNNMGFKRYLSTIKVIEMEGGCHVEWSFAADPVEGWRFEDLLSYVEMSLKGMGENIEKALVG